MNITIDGMPINEPEDSAFYFSNFGDFANAVDSIQVQRGVGTSSVGAASFAGSINFASAAFTDRPEAVVRMGAGSFGSRRVSATVNSGSFGGGFKVYAQAATQDSDGFREHSSVKQRSVYLGAIRESGASYFKIFGFVGREQSQLAYLAADEAALATDLRVNPMTPEERDLFDQRFVTAQYHRALGPRTELALQGFYNSADGWYRIRDAAAGPSGLFQYGLGWHNAGASANVHAASAHADFTWGAFFSDFESRHTRDIVDGAADYVNHGYKHEFNTFAKFAWSSGRWRYFGDAQLRWARFRYDGSLTLGSIDWTFFNPKVGTRFDAGHGVSLYASVGRAEREPARSDMLQGEDNATIQYDLAAVRPEQVVNGEFGVNLAWPGFSAQVNGYVMAFRHEIAQTGELSEIGLPLRRNVDRSSRSGVEVDLTWHPVQPLQIRHTATYSRNRIDTWTQFYDVYDADGNWLSSTSRAHHDVPPYVTPAVLATVSGDYTPARGATVGATWKYVGESHLDNTGNPDFTAPSFTSLDLSASIDLARALGFAAAAHPVLRLHVNNVLDNRRIFPNGYSYQYFVSGPGPSSLTLEGTRYFYPLATRNAFVGLELRF
jgi:iron complex outermembrane receptor protein